MRFPENTDSTLPSVSVWDWGPEPPSLRRLLSAALRLRECEPAGVDPADMERLLYCSNHKKKKTYRRYRNTVPKTDSARKQGLAQGPGTRGGPADS